MRWIATGAITLVRQLWPPISSAVAQPSHPSQPVIGLARQ